MKPTRTDDANAAAVKEMVAKLVKGTVAEAENRDRLPVVAGNVGLISSDLLDRGTDHELVGKIEEYAKTLPEPALWAPGEVEELEKQVAAAAEARSGQPGGRYDRPEVCGSSDEPGDATGDLAHIRQMILADFPQAGTATDEELEALYDEWAAQHGE